MRMVYDLNPLGPPSIFALLLGVLLVVLTCRFTKLPGWFQRKLITIAPYGLMLLFFWPPFGGAWMHHIEADDPAAQSVYLAFALAFAYANMRFCSIFHGINGIVTSAAVLTAISLWILEVNAPQNWGVYGTYDNSTIGYAAIALCWLTWPVLLFKPAGRKELADLRKLAGCCAACGYDLRGNADGDSCPECGQSIAKDTRFEPLDPA